MNRSFARFFTSAFVAAAVFLSAGTVWLKAGQEVDPFYLKALRNGETFYQAKNFKDAAKSFEIAMFGLHATKDALAKASAYLGLCCSNLGDQSGAERNLRSALTILGREGLAALAFPEAVKADLQQTIRLLRIEVLPPVAAAPPAGPPSADAHIPAKDAEPVRSPDSGKPEGGRISALEEEIRQTPRRTEFYYELGRLQMDGGDPAAARRTYQKMLANNPAEIRGYLELGKLAYRERSLKEAERQFEKFLDPSNHASVERLLVVEGKVYLALSAYLRGDSKKVLAILRDAPELSDRSSTAALTLAVEDRDRLEQILRRIIP